MRGGEEKLSFSNLDGTPSDTNTRRPDESGPQSRVRGGHRGNKRRVDRRDRERSIETESEEGEEI